MAKSDLTAERLRELLHYDPDTGIFTWRVCPRHPRLVGKQAGGIVKHGYLVTAIDGTHYKCHRLVWLYVHSKWPPEHIDHINGIRSDNRLLNLRIASRAINNQNRRKPVTGSASGLLGVTPYRNKWVAQISVNFMKIHIGVYKTPELAHAAYIEAKRRLHPGCTL